MLIGLLAAGATGARADSASPLPREIAPGIYVLSESTNEASSANRGRIGNAGFIVGPSGTTVIEAGTSFAHGRALIAAAEAVGGQPLQVVILTQPLPEFVLGGSAFAARGIRLLAHEEAARLIARRCDECLARLRTLLGDEAMAGSRLPAPDWRIVTSARLEAGERELHVLAFEHASAPGDLAVLDVQSGVLFAGALVSNRRVPDLQDADPQGWLAALEQLATLPHRLLVPGYGEVDAGHGTAIAATRAYLHAAIGYARRRFDAGDSLHDVLRQAASATEFAAWAGWPGYAAFHRRNVQKLYLEYEAQVFAAEAKAQARVIEADATPAIGKVKSSP